MNFAFNPPLQLFGQTIFSLSGLIQYAKFYSNELKNHYNRVDQEVNARVKANLHYLLNKDKDSRKSSDHWKKKYFKLKSRSHIKYEVFENPTTGVKVLIPHNIPRLNKITGINNWSPKQNIEELIQILKNCIHTYSIFEKEKCESEDKALMHDTKYEGSNSYSKVGNPYRYFDSKQHIKRK